jgi:hypothetical protein
VGTASAGAGLPTPISASPAEADGFGEPNAPGEPDGPGEPDAAGEPDTAGEPDGPGEPSPDGDETGADDVGDAEATGDAEGVAGAGVASDGRLGASSTTPPSRAAPTSVPMTRPAAIAVLPPIARERTSTNRSTAPRSALDYDDGPCPVDPLPP